MAQAGVFLERDDFKCFFCLDIMKDPVTIPCGHSYCKCCIKGYWDQDDCYCPECRQSFAPRPVLCTNTILAQMIELLRRRQQDVDSKVSATEEEEVAEDAQPFTPQPKPRLAPSSGSTL